MPDDDFDEFSFLPVQAAEYGAPVPDVTRISGAAPDGRRISALRFGGDISPDVTFVHGAGLNAHTWDRTVLALGRPAFAVDLPGHGDSDWRDDAGYTGRQLADDLVPALQTWAERPQVLVGQSLGGMTVAAIAATAPDLVSAIVLVDIAPGLDPLGGAAQIREFFAGPTDWASRDELVDRALAFGLGGDRAAAERGVFLNSRVREDGRVEWKHHFARIANARAKDAASGAAGHDAAPQPSPDALAAVLAESGWDDLAAVTVPIVLVRGDRGFLGDDDVAEFSRRLPEALVHTLPSGHNVQEEQPVELARIVRDAVVAASDTRAAFHVPNLPRHST